MNQHDKLRMTVLLFWHSRTPLSKSTSDWLANARGLRPGMADPFDPAGLVFYMADPSNSTLLFNPNLVALRH